MVKSEDIEYAIQETLIAHPEFQPYLTQILLRNIQKEIYLRSFTSQNGARDKVIGLRDIDLVNYVVLQLIKIVNSATYYSLNDPDIEIEPDENKYRRLLEVFPCYEECKELLNNSSKCNKILYFLTNPTELIRAVICVTKSKFSNSKLKDYINKYCDYEVDLENTSTQKYLKDLNRDFVSLEHLNSININKDCYNLCLVELLTDKQLVNKNSEYVLYGSLYASQNVGKRANQEDSVLIMEHPVESEFKLLAVSDGVGSASYGHEASIYITKELAKWFSILPVELFKQPTELHELFNRKINQISNEIYKKYNKDGKFRAGSTFTGAIVTNDKTIISTVGDSRAYTLSENGKIDLLTRDESAVWPQQLSSQELGFDYIDDIRFNKKSNRILNSIGYKLIEEIQCYQIANDSYNKLLLLTDGVTDLLTTNRIKVIAQSTPKDIITKMLVDEAISHNAIRHHEQDSNYNDYIEAGKDNASAAMFVRR